MMMVGKMKATERNDGVRIINGEDDDDRNENQQPVVGGRCWINPHHQQSQHRQSGVLLILAFVVIEIPLVLLFLL